MRAENQVTEGRGAGRPRTQDLPATALAYLGDAVYELSVRERLLAAVSRPAGSLHRQAVRLVNAAFQAEAIRFLEAELTPAETAVFKRGRNADPGAMPRHADPVDYRLATGLEALVGFLYREGQQDRLSKLMDLIFQYAADSGVLN